MSLLDPPFVLRYRAASDPMAPGEHRLAVAGTPFGVLENVGPVPAMVAAERAADGSALFESGIRLGESQLLRWLEQACRDRGLYLDPSVLVDLARRRAERDGDPAAARAMLEHVMAWARLDVRPGDADSVHAMLIPGAARTAVPTEWASEPWAYRDERIPRRKNDRPLPLHAPEFDRSWSAEFRSVLLCAPPQRSFNSVPLLAVFVNPLSFRDPFWDWDIVRILREYPQKAPKDVLELDEWYPPHPARPGHLEDLTEWTGRRLLDGFCGLPLQVEATAGGPRYSMEVDWSDVSHSFRYELPNVRVSWEQRAGVYGIVEVEIAERRFVWKLLSLPADWRDRPDDYFHIRRVVRADGDRLWQHALFIARSAVLLAGEVDVHLARAHLLIEAYALLFEIDGTDAALKPVKEILAPFLRDVTGINRLGDALVLGSNGVLCEDTGLSEDALAARLANQLATTDWKGFAPRADHPVLADARYPVAAKAFWTGIGTMVRRLLAEVPAEDRPALVAALAQAVEAHNHRFRDLPGAVLRPRPGNEFVWEQEWVRQLDAERSRISVPATFEDVEQLCCYVIFHATFVHGWVNDEAWIDGGSLRHAVFSLRDLDPPARGQSWDEWFRRSGPTRRSAALQLSVGWTLDRVSWGRMGDPSDLLTSEAMDKLAHGEKRVFVALQAAMREGNPSPESELARIGRPLSTWRIRINS